MIKQKSFKLKFKKYTNLIIPLIGITLFAAALALFWFWEVQGREMFLYKDVVVLKEEVQRGDIITNKMLGVMKIEAENSFDNAIEDEQQILGLVSKQFVPANTQLHPNYFEKPELIADKDTYIMRIPNDWLYSVPNTIRRGDQAYFHVTTPADAFINNRNPEIIPTHEENEKLDIEDSNKDVVNVTVAYVKDTMNREVRTVSEQPRLDATSNIGNIEVFITKEQTKKLEEQISKGKKFIVTYQE